MTADIQHIINKTLHLAALGGHRAEFLVFATGAVESGYKKIIQYSNGPARSFWQVEPATAVDIFNNFLKYNQKLLSKVKGITGLIIHPDKITEPEAAWYLTTNLAFAIIMCRLVYYRVKDPLPEGINPCAHYWKQHYNTRHGKGTIEDFILKINQKET